MIAAELPQRYAVADDHWSSIGLSRLSQTLGDSLTLDNPLARLRAYDRQHGSELLKTISVWLINNCDTSRTAAALCLHPNTLRYRLRRAQQISGLTLDDAASRVLALTLAWATQTAPARRQ